MTERELRQCRHQIGAAVDSDQLSTGAALAITVILSLALWGTGWAFMALVVNAWLQPFQ